MSDLDDYSNTLRQLGKREFRRLFEGNFPPCRRVLVPKESFGDFMREVSEFLGVITRMRMYLPVGVGEDAERLDRHLVALRGMIVEEKDDGGQGSSGDSGVSGVGQAGGGEGAGDNDHGNT